jgi:phasin family protein
MFDKFNEQMQKSFKPMTDLIAVNTEVLEKLSEKQATLFSTLVNEGVAFTKEVSGQQDVNKVVESQKVYVEGLQEKLTSAAKESYDVITEAQEKAGEVFKTAMQDIQTSMQVK